MDFVEVVKNIKDFLTGLGVSLLLPIIITTLGLIFGQKLRCLRYCNLRCSSLCMHLLWLLLNRDGDFNRVRNS